MFGWFGLLVAECYTNAALGWEDFVRREKELDLKMKGQTQKLFILVERKQSRLRGIKVSSRNTFSVFIEISQYTCIQENICYSFFIMSTKHLRRCLQEIERQRKEHENEGSFKSSSEEGELEEAFVRNRLPTYSTYFRRPGDV